MASVFAVGPPDAQFEVDVTNDVVTVLAGGVQVLGEQGAAVANIATANADATYGQPEADLINELKAQVNALLAVLRTHGVIAT